MLDVGCSREFMGPNSLLRPPSLRRKAFVGLEGMTKGVLAGVARRLGHFAHAVARIAEQLPGLGQPDFFQVVVEGHARRLTEQGGEVGGVHLHDRGQFVQVERALAMLMHVVEHRVNELLGVAAQTRLDCGFLEIRQPMAQFPAKARGLALSMVQSPQGVFQFGPRHPGLGGGFQIVKDQTYQSHRVTEGGERNRFPVRQRMRDAGLTISISLVNAVR